MAAAEKDLDIDQGATFSLAFIWYPSGAIDPETGLPYPEDVLDSEGNPKGAPHKLTGCTARMQIRRKQGTEAVVTATSDPVSGIDDPAIAQGAGRIRLGGDTGRIEITLTDEDTDQLDFTSGKYDLEVEWPLDVEAGEIRARVDRVLQGSVTVDPNITQVDNEDPVVTEELVGNG